MPRQGFLVAPILCRHHVDDVDDGRRRRQTVYAYTHMLFVWIRQGKRDDVFYIIIYD